MSDTCKCIRSVACDAQKLIVLTSIATKNALQIIRGASPIDAVAPFLSIAQTVTPFLLPFVESFSAITCQLMEMPCLSCDCLHLIICLQRQLNAFATSLSASLTAFIIAAPTFAPSLGTAIPLIDQVAANTQATIVLFEKLRSVCLRAETEDKVSARGTSKVDRAVFDSLGFFYNVVGETLAAIQSTTTAFAVPPVIVAGRTTSTASSIATDLSNITGVLFNLAQLNVAEPPNCRLPVELAQDFCSLANSLSAIAAIITVASTGATDDLAAALATALSAALSQLAVCLISKHGKFAKCVSNCRDIQTTCRFLPLTIAVSMLEQDIPAAVTDFGVTFVPAACAPFFPSCNPLCRLTTSCPAGRRAAP